MPADGPRTGTSRSSSRHWSRTSSSRQSVGLRRGAEYSPGFMTLRSALDADSNARLRRQWASPQLMNRPSGVRSSCLSTPQKFVFGLARRPLPRPLHGLARSTIDTQPDNNLLPIVPAADPTLLIHPTCPPMFVQFQSFATGR